MTSYGTSPLSVHLFVTVPVLMMVVLMPIIDRFLCRKLGLNLLDGISANPKAPRYLWIRKLIICMVFAAYLSGFLYVVFFSRSACFVISLAVENIQLISRHGFYDLDDLVTNTIGGLIGELAFIAFAYVVTHPDWRRELKRYHRWKKYARRTTCRSRYLSNKRGPS